MVRKMSNLVLRKALEEEISQIITMQTEVFCGEQGIPAELIDTFLLNQPTCWVAEQEGQIVGTIASWMESGEVHLGRFVVLPHLRGQKIGTKLLNHAICELFSSGVEKIYMEARDSVAKMIRTIGGRDIGEPFVFYRGNVTPLVLERSSQCILTMTGSVCT